MQRALSFTLDSAGRRSQKRLQNRYKMSYIASVPLKSRSILAREDSDTII